MAELQKLLRSISGDTKPSFLPASLFNLKSEPQNIMETQMAGNKLYINGGGADFFPQQKMTQQMTNQMYNANNGASNVFIKQEPQEFNGADANGNTPFINGHVNNGANNFPPQSPSLNFPQMHSPMSIAAQQAAASPMGAPPPEILAGIITPPQSHTPQPPLHQQENMFTMESAAHMSMHNMAQLVEEARTPPSHERLVLINQVIDTVIDSHMATCNYTADKVAAGIAKYEQRKRDGQLPDMKAMAQMSGNGDPSAMWGEFVKNMVPVITRVVKFCKKLPGFLELTEDDQIKLIKQGSFEVVLARYTALFQGDGMFVPAMDIKIPRMMVNKMPMGEFFEQQFDFGHKFNALELTDGEIGLLTSIMIMNPSRKSLANKKAVHRLQGLFLQSLYTHMRNTRPPHVFDELFVKTMAVLPELEKINEEHAKTLNGMKMNLSGGGGNGGGGGNEGLGLGPPSDMGLPPLHVEVYNISGEH